MPNCELKAQILTDVGELERMGADYPPGSVIRLAFIGFAETLRREFSLSDSEKIEIVLMRLKGAQPCPKTEFVDHLDFSRDESRRLIDEAIRLCLVEQFQEHTNGRARLLLRLP